MTRDELRRLAISLARRPASVGGYVVTCSRCAQMSETSAMHHTKDCPIAELEAEEAAATKKTAGKFEGEY